MNEILAGHSLGAHIAGSAGRNLNSMTSQLIPRITGLGRYAKLIKICVSETLKF